MRNNKKKNFYLIILAVIAVASAFINMDVHAQDVTPNPDMTGLKEQNEENNEPDMESRQIDEEIPWVLGREVDEETGEIIWPNGVTYDAGTNTLTLDNVVLEINEDNWEWQFIEYSGTKDLVIRLHGKNIFKCTRNDDARTPAISASYQSQGDLYITGNGSLELQAGSLIWDQSYNGDAGDLYIDGVTIISDHEGFMSQYSNITIKNSTIDINNRFGKNNGFYGEAFGICTGRIDGNNDDIEKDGVRYEGLLTVENSNIDIKNCYFPIAANEIKLVDCSLYGGNEYAEYKIDPKRVYLHADYGYGGAERYYYENGCMKISTQDLKLPEAYYLYDAYEPNDKSNCYITLPAFAGAGQTVDVKMYLETGYRLKNIYVNGRAVSGTSFVMPEQDTTVKAVFEKIDDTKKQSLIPVSKISISGISKKIAAGKKIKLTAMVSPSNATKKAVKWESGNTNVAKVDSSGIVTMNKKSGGKTVTITATATDGSGVKASYKITSMKGVVKKVAISGKKTMKAGKTLKLKAKVTATKKANKKLKWTSSNKKYATVSSAGKVKALKAGKGKKVKITAAATDGSGKKKTITIKIK
ncbi:VCBS protein [Lachnospiraceae bacterium MD308]|nr:VCBS protein [Lachnospiraceae bacterium MD308]MCI8502714.1 Ig-like domain-containing protein [Dorea sp.]